jgi:hypothetical protein
MVWIYHLDFKNEKNNPYIEEIRAMHSTISQLYILSTLIYFDEKIIYITIEIFIIRYLHKKNLKLVFFPIRCCFSFKFPRISH